MMMRKYKANTGTEESDNDKFMSEFQKLNTLVCAFCLKRQVWQLWMVNK